MTPKLTTNEKDTDYHNSPGISSSGLKLFHDSPIKYWAKYICPDPDSDDEKDKPHFAIGKAGHCKVLEPHRFESDFVAMPEGIDKRSKDGKAFWKELKTKYPEATIMKNSELALAKKCGDSILNSRYGKLISSGIGCAETSIRWVDPDTEVHCKIRPDWFLAPLDKVPNGMIIDLKFSDGSDEDSFRKSVENFGYYIQNAFYCLGYQAYYSTKDLPKFIFVVVDKNYPYTVENYELSLEFIEMGLAVIKNRLPQFKECLDSGKWLPESKSKTTIIEPNEWKFNKEMAKWDL